MQDNHNYKKEFPWLGLALFPLLIGSAVVLLSNTFKDLPKDSVRKSATVIKKQTTLTPVNMILASNVQSEQTQTTVSPDEVFYSKFDLSQPLLANNLNELENEHKELLNQYRKNKKFINSKMRLNPRLLIVISFYLEKEIENISNRDIDELNFTSSEWYLLKTFSQSKDFEILLKREKLESKHVQIQELQERFNRLVQV